MRHLIRALGLVAALGATTAAMADGLVVVKPTPAQRQQGLRNFPLHVKYHRVKTRIDGQVCVTSIDQVFNNPTQFRLEGTYIFPVPKGATISKFSMDIDGKPVKGEVLGRDKARQIYEGIVRQNLDPALLEYVGTQVVKLRIFPIEPRSDKRIKITYTEVLEADKHLVTYRYPLNTEKFSSGLLDEVSVEVKIADDQPIGTIYSPTHKVFVQRKDAKTATVRFEANKVRPDRDFVVSYLRSAEAVGLSALTYKRAGEKEGYYSFVISPNIAASKSDIQPKDVVFVLDTSGSMLEQNKIGQARKALRYCLGRLGAKDRFNIVDFSTDVRTFKDGLVSVDEATRKACAGYIDDLEASGGTNIDEALRRAMEMAGKAQAGRPFVVVFLTDGQATIGERNTLNILSNVKKATGEGVTCRLFSFGIGHDINTHLLDQLSRVRRGTTTYVEPGENLEVKVSSFFDKIAYPVLTDLKLTVKDVQLKDAYPRPLPDLFRGSQLVVMGRYIGAGAQAIELTGRYMGEKKSFVFETTFADKATDHEHLPHLWAQRKVGHLIEQIRLHGENAEMRQEVVNLAKQYGIMTPYTSFLVMEDVARNPRPMKGAPAAAPARAFGRFSKKDRDEAQDGMKQQSGGKAVGAAKEGKRLSNALRLNDAENSLGGDDGGTGQRAIRRVGSKTFYRAGDAWIDSAYEAKTMAAKLRKVEAMSDAYFKLLTEFTELGRYLALGQVIVVTAKGDVIQVTPRVAKK